MMRRILWSLTAGTAMSAVVPGMMAQEPFAFPEPPTQQEPGATRTPLSFSSGRSTEGGTTAGRSYAELLAEEGSRPFPAERQALPRAGSLSNARAGELFRREPTGTPAPAGQTGRMLEDQFQRVAAEQVQVNKDVVHAEYERLPGQRDAIEHVRGTIAREFPPSGGSPFLQPAQSDQPALPMAVTPTATPAASPAASPFERGPASQFIQTTASEHRPAPVNSRLTEPIATSPTGGERFPAIQPSVQSSRGVTFTRSSPEPRAPEQPIIQQTAATIPEGVSSLVNTAAASMPEVDANGALARTIRSGPQSPSLSVEWVTRGGINVGQECECSLVVKNSGIISATQVEVSAEFPASVRLVSAEPQPLELDSRVGWKFDELQPGEEQTIKVVMIPSTPGKIDTKAEVRFSGAALSSLTVAEPLIEVAVEGPQRVLIGEPASQTVTVKNPGSGIATNVQIEAVIPTGLEHARGERLVMEVGSLNPGESRSVRLALAAVQGGRQVVQVQARADGDLLRNITSDVQVVAPMLAAAIDGPNLRYLGRPAVYTLHVRNDGEINVENVRVMHKMPEGFEVVETDRGAQFDRPNRLVNWFVGRLAAGQTAELKVTVKPNQIGSFTHFIRATSEHGAIADAQFSTNVEGTPSLAMEIRDLDDPVEIGVETAYEIVVKNDGSAAARGVTLTCEIPEGMDVINAQGPVDSIKQRDLVSFNPVQELAPGNSVTYRVHIRGNIGGLHRLRAKLSSESNPDPITGDEVTRFYGE